MAFQTSALPGLVVATTEMWPAMSNAIGSSPWRTFGRQRGTLLFRPSERFSQGLRALSTSTASQSSQVEPPQRLRAFPTSSSSTLSSQASSQMPQMPFTLRHLKSVRPNGAFWAASPVVRHAFSSLQPKQTSTGPLHNRFQPARIGSGGKKTLQGRTLFGSASSRSTLAYLEETANKNPNSTSSQYIFYQALLRAGMPAIVVERYEANQFATNGAIDDLYNQALGMLNNGHGTDSGTPATTTNQFSGQNTGNLSNNQLQAIGQAIAAKTRGANMSTSKGANAGQGGKGSPLHVVVEETISSHIFKWLKFALWFGLVTYLSLVVVAMLMEIFQNLRKTTGKQSNEAKAEHQTVRFSHVHGCDEAKEELQELVDFLKNPDKFSSLGGKLPKGVLLVGPPGTGKTLLARAVAGEAGVPFFFMSGSEFDEMYVGVGAKRVRDLFGAAKEKSPAIVFIDELDAIGGKRNPRDVSYSKQTLNQLLTELDGFEQNSGIIILAATNFPELLDKALTRPGRFDRNVVVGLPDVRGRIAILEHHTRNILKSSDVSLENLAAATPGCSGAELENIVNQAAVHASKAKAEVVSMLDLEWAREKTMWGAERKSMFMTQEEKELTAYHEAGHALVIMFSDCADPLHKITIMPRGQALGMTMHLPKMDKYSQGKREYEAQIDVCMGGKAAEELHFGPEQVTSGVSSDLKQATRVAYSMVTMFGMSDTLGNVDLASNHDTLSTGTKMQIESEVRRLIEEGRQRATAILVSKRKELDLLAKALMDYETLDKDEAFKVIKGEKLTGKIKASSKVPVKLPEVSVPISGGGLSELPPIPGSEKPESKGTSAGGSVAA